MTRPVRLAVGAKKGRILLLPLIFSQLSNRPLVPAPAVVKRQRPAVGDRGDPLIRRWPI